MDLLSVQNTHRIARTHTFQSFRISVTVTICLCVCCRLSVSNERKKEWKATIAVEWKTYSHSHTLCSISTKNKRKELCITRPAVDRVWFDRTLFWVCLVYDIRSALLMHIHSFWLRSLLLACLGCCCCCYCCCYCWYFFVHFICRACLPTFLLILMNNFGNTGRRCSYCKCVNGMCSIRVCMPIFLFTLIDRNWQYELSVNCSAWCLLLLYNTSIKMICTLVCEHICVCVCVCDRICVVVCIFVCLIRVRSFNVLSSILFISFSLIMSFHQRTSHNYTTNPSTNWIFSIWFFISKFDFMLLQNFTEHQNLYPIRINFKCFSKTDKKLSLFSCEVLKSVLI